MPRANHRHNHRRHRGNARRWREGSCGGFFENVRTKLCPRDSSEHRALDSRTPLSRDYSAAGYPVVHSPDSNAKAFCELGLPARRSAGAFNRCAHAVTIACLYGSFKSATIFFCL